MALFEKWSKWVTRIGIAAIAISGIGLIVVVVGVAALNSEFRAAQVSSLVLPGPQGEHPFRVNLVIESLDEASNTALLHLQNVARPSPTMDSIVRGKLAVVFTLQTGLEDQELDREIALRFDTSAAHSVSESGIALEASFKSSTIRAINPFPFDDHDLFFAIWNRGTDGITRAFSLKVTKRTATRVLVLTGEPAVPQIALSRPRSQKGFILFSSVVFLLLTGTLAYKVHIDPRRVSGPLELLSVAGLILGIAGFREVIGLSSAVHFTLLELLVVGIPLAALAAGFLRAALRSGWSGG